MFEAWGRGLYRARRLTLVDRPAVRGGRRSLGNRRVRQAQLGQHVHPAEQPEQRGKQPRGQRVRPRRRRRRGAVPQRRAHGRRPGLPAGGDRLPRRPAGGRRRPGRPPTGRAGSTHLVSADRHSTYAVLQLARRRPGAGQKTRTRPSRMTSLPAAAGDGITAQVGGTVPTEVAINDEVSANIARAESISFPVLLILLVVIFGSVVAASPRSRSAAWRSSARSPCCGCSPGHHPVSVYSVNITTILGLGLGIDYGLFIVTRFREELRRQPPSRRPWPGPWPPRAGPSLVSGVTVALALSSLMLFQPGLPPLDGLRRRRHRRGRRDRGAHRAARAARRPRPPGQRPARPEERRARAPRRETPRAAGTGSRAASCARPVAYAAVIVVVLLALGAPFLRISWGGDRRPGPPGLGHRPAGVRRR